MGYALFTARKLSLQAKVNNYNLQLTKIQNEQDKLTQKIARQQGKNDAIDAAQTKGKGAGSVIGGVLGFALGGVVGSAIGSTIGKIGGSIVNAAIDKRQEKDTENSQENLAIQQQKLDREKGRIETLLKAADTELHKVEDAETKAIERSTAKYVA